MIDDLKKEAIEIINKPSSITTADWVCELIDRAFRAGEEEANAKRQITQFSGIVSMYKKPTDKEQIALKDITQAAAKKVQADMSLYSYNQGLFRAAEIIRDGKTNAKHLSGKRYDTILEFVATAIEKEAI